MIATLIIVTFVFYKKRFELIIIVKKEYASIKIRYSIGARWLSSFFETLIVINSKYISQLLEHLGVSLAVLIK